MQSYVSKIVLTLGLLLALCGCYKQVGPTHLYVQDPVRHYLPIVQGNKLKLEWKLRNDGPYPLVIEDIQPACMAIELVSEVPHVIAAGDSLYIIYEFNTDYTIGFAQHYIRIFGNIVPDGHKTLSFDVHVVRPALDHSDTEEKAEDNQSMRDRLGAKPNLYYTGHEDPDYILGVKP